MKLKIFTLLLAFFLITGCGSEQPVKNNLSTETTVKETPQTEAGTSTENQETTSQEPYLVSFEASTLENETITSDIFAESKLTMLNVWATYCNPCLNEMPDLAEIAASYDSADFQMLGIISDVSVFSEDDAIATAKDLVAQTGATTYPHLLLNQSLYDTLVGAVDSVPTTFFVNQNGELLGYVIGAKSKETWEDLIDELLAEMQ